MSQRAATAAKPLTRKPDADELAMSIAEWLASAIESGATPAQILQPFTTAIGAAVATYADSSAKPGHEGVVITDTCKAILHRARAAHQAAPTATEH